MILICLIPPKKRAVIFSSGGGCSCSSASSPPQCPHLKFSRFDLTPGLSCKDLLRKSGSSTMNGPGNQCEDVFARIFGTSSGSQSPTNKTRNPEDIFSEFFGASSTQARKPPAVETKLPCTLEELYNGATRKLKISRNTVKQNGQVVTETEILTVNIKPGWKKGTKITFPDKGNEHLFEPPADLVFVIDEKPHDVYTREGNDLLVYKKLDLVDALAGTTIKLNTLDGRDLAIQLTDVVAPGYELVVAKEGMPFAKENGRRGNMRIKFDVEFPKRLSEEQRRNIRKDLEG